MDMINVKVNGVDVTAPKGTTILQAARMANVDIPTLCYLKDINEIGACRICVVEADEGRGKRLVASCVYPVTEGIRSLQIHLRFWNRERKLSSLSSQHMRRSVPPA